MKILVTGVTGQLGYDVMCELGKRGHVCIGAGRAGIEGLDIEGIRPYDETSGGDSDYSEANTYINLDITDSARVDNVISMISPEAVIHCAAWTAVDKAEEESNRAKVYAVNVKGTENLVMACSRIDAKLLYISTDYVFDGQGEEPWKADCSCYNPLNYYGKTKLEGELIVSNILSKYFIVRIAWVFGKNGNNFVKTMLNIGEKYEQLRVVDDQIGTPAYTADLAILLADMIESDKYGYYHATNEGGYISWYDFACEIFRQAGYRTKVHPISTEEYGISAAKRPANSRLDKSKLSEEGFNRLPDWRDALSRYLKEIKKL